MGLLSREVSGLDSIIALGCSEWTTTNNFEQFSVRSLLLGEIIEVLVALEMCTFELSSGF